MENSPRAYCEACRADVPVEIKHMVYKVSRKKFTRIICSECGQTIAERPGIVDLPTERLRVAAVDPDITH